VGYLPEQPYVYDYLTCREYLDYVGRLHGLASVERSRRAEALLTRVDLRAAADQRMRTYSKGMQQRAALAQALMGDPELVFLDEPMSGLDPLGRRLVRELILDLRREGRTVFFSTHILGDAETLCDQVALLSRGRLLAVGALDAILQVEVEHHDVLVTGVNREQLRALPEGCRLVHDLGERLSLAVPEQLLARALALVADAGGKVLHVQPVRQSLEDYFVREVAPDVRRSA
jgi:ABC-2 type transport system ATP-binding protein